MPDSFIEGLPPAAEGLAEGEKFSDFKLHTIDNSFGSWFAFEGNGKEAAPPPSETRTSLAVWIGLLVGNLLSRFIMSFLTMPYYVNPLLGR
ncbi:hypothetical protein [Streptomyces chartreusis]